jgi:hypothetical protein
MQSISCVALFCDVRVSYAGRGEVAEFGLQKIHNLGRVSGVGFAGSVEIGFSEVRRLRALADAIGGVAEVPDIIERWYQGALDGYSGRYDESLRDLGCDSSSWACRERRSWTPTEGGLGFRTRRGRPGIRRTAASFAFRAVGQRARPPSTSETLAGR